MSARIAIRAVVVLSVCGLALCNCSNQEDNLPYAPDDCQSTKPEIGSLSIQLTINAQNSRVPIEVYLGHIEDGMIIRSESLSVPAVEYMLPVGGAYTVTARYLVGPDTVLVIAQDDITADQTEYHNSVFCWELKDAFVNVRLRR